MKNKTMEKENNKQNEEYPSIKEYKRALKENETRKTREIILKVLIEKCWRIIQQIK